MRRTPMKRTGRLGAFSATRQKIETNREQRLTERAKRAIKSVPHRGPVKIEGNSATALAVSAESAINTRADLTSSVTTAARPKTQPQRNPALRAMARGRVCLLQVRGVCSRDSSTVVCCHSNMAAHGKGKARKADDQYSVQGCAACHAWLDQGPAPRAQKEAAFMAAHLRQVLAWRALAADARTPSKDRAAAQWALDRLSASPVGEVA